jgi:Outer membrane lipoprotein-sorting protein
MRLFPTALALAFISAVPGYAAGPAAPDLQKLLSGPRQAVEKADYRASGHLVRVDAAGKRTSYDISIKAHWFPGVLRILAEITSPASARAHMLLEMRPDGQHSILIAHPGDKAPTPLAFDKWSDGPLGPGFSYEDLLEQEYFWPDQAFLESARRGTRDCDVLRSKPGAVDKTHYAEVRTWLDRTIDFPVYLEKTMKTGGKLKQFTYYGLRHDGGVWSATQIEEKSDGQPGSTLLIINRGSPKANLNATDFSPDRLTHF